MSTQTIFSLSVLLALSACTTLAPVQPSKLIENSLGMKFVLVPVGEFLMGSAVSPESLSRDFTQYSMDRLQDLGDEAPVHLVKLTRAFYLRQHEVTVGQCRQFLQASGYRPESIADGTGGYGYNPTYDLANSKSGDAFEGRDPKYSWANPGFVQGDDEPVVNVSWVDALSMTRWLSQVEGKHYRLPTEAEWEYACRAGTKSHYHNGNDPQQLAKVANVFDIDSAKNWPQWKIYAVQTSDGYPFTSPVGSFSPNAFGLYDMIGNAWEWVSDYYQDDYYVASPTNDPEGPVTDSRRVRRGGSWHTWPLYARCAYRNINTEASRYPLLGMRLLREADVK